MYICINLQKCIYVYIYRSVYMYTSTEMYICIFLQKCKYVYIYKNVNINNVYTYRNVIMYKSTEMYISQSTHIYKNV